MSGLMKLLQEHRSGATHDNIAEALRDLVAAVTDEGKGGKLTVTIAIKPIGKGDGLEVAIDVNSSPPKPSPGVSIFFATPDNDLQRQDPRQQNLELRDITPSSAAKALA